MSEPSGQPLLNAEWLRQPQAVELVHLMAAFAAAMQGHLSGSSQGDFWPGQELGRPNPMAQPIPAGEGIPHEQAGFGPAPAPYGYTDSGRVKLGPNQTDANAPGGISEWAPNRTYGPSVNRERQTPENPGNAQGGGRVKAE